MTDVARLAGVSPSTVSRALSGGKGVSAEKRAEILRLVAELRYTVSPDASRLARGEFNRVAVVVRDTETWFYYSILGAVETVLREANFDVLFYRVASSSERDQFFEQLPARRQVEAVILVGVPLTDRQVDRMTAMNVPVVMAGSHVPHFPSVHIDESLAAEHAVNHLLHLRHTRIGRIGITDPDGRPWQPELGRQEGYLRALARAGIEVDPALSVNVEFSTDGGARAMDRLLSLPQPPSAVLAFSDELAIGAMRSLRRLGLHVPGDISLVGIDDHPMAELSDLTTVRQPVHEIGREAAAIVLRILRGEPAAENTVLPTTLVVRGSSGPAPAAR